MLEEDVEFTADRALHERYAIEFIEAHRDRPFFCYVPHNVVHRPLYEDESLIEKYRRKPGADPTVKLEGLKLANSVELLYNAPAKIATVPFKGHMSNLQNVRDALRAWAMTRGYETIERPYESWKNGIDPGFAPGQEGEYDVVWALK